MTLFLTKKELQSKRSVERKMFTCIKPESVEPDMWGRCRIADWEVGTYISRDIKNGVEPGLRSSRILLNRIFPFAVNLFNTRVPEFIERGHVAWFKFNIEIETQEGIKEVGEFILKPEDNPNLKENISCTSDNDLPHYLNQSFKIIIKVNVTYLEIYPAYIPQEEVDFLPLTTIHSPTRCYTLYYG